MATAAPYLVSPELDAGKLLSDPLTVSELAHLFGYSRKRFRPILDEIEGAEPFGTRWRIPLHKMPPKYLIGQGLLSPFIPHSKAVEMVDLLTVRDEMSRLEQAGRAASNQPND